MAGWLAGLAHIYHSRFLFIVVVAPPERQRLHIGGDMETQKCYLCLLMGNCVWLNRLGLGGREVREREREAKYIVVFGEWCFRGHWYADNSRWCGLVRLLAGWQIESRAELLGRCNTTFGQKKATGGLIQPPRCWFPVLLAEYCNHETATKRGGGDHKHLLQK